MFYGKCTCARKLRLRVHEETQRGEIQENTREEKRQKEAMRKRECICVETRWSLCMSFRHHTLFVTETELLCKVQATRAKLKYFRSTQTILIRWSKFKKSRYHSFERNTFEIFFRSIKICSFSISLWHAYLNIILYYFQCNIHSFNW